MEEYLKIVDYYFRDFPELGKEKLHEDARRFAAERASKGARIAWQFYQTYDK